MSTFEEALEKQRSGVVKNTKQVRILTCGGRNYFNHRFIAMIMDGLVLEAKQFFETDDIVVAHGAATGADTLVDHYCKERKIDVKRYRAKWETHGRSAGPIRNREMLEDFKPDMVIAFPGGPGTADMVEIAKAANVPIRQYQVSEDWGFTIDDQPRPIMQDFNK